VAAPRCKRSSQVRKAVVPAAGVVEVVLQLATVEYTLRVVAAAGFAGVAWSLAYADGPSTLLHFAAGEGWQEERMQLAGPITLRIGAVAGAIAELVVWEG